MPHRFHPVLSAWFAERFGEPTDVQKRAWPLIAEGAHTLVAAPTGSGKTLAALLPLLDRLIREKLQGGREAAERGVRILYVTPLKALNNDIRRHLFDFRDEWRAAAERMGVPWPEVSVAVRTGDTTHSERASMVRKPPDVLVTTPESLFILLTSRKARDILRTVRHVVADEIHDLAAGERGAHFSVTLERLAELCGHPPQRIGVSATVNPVRRVARFLGGWEEREDGRYRPRPVAIVESPMERALEVTVTVPPYGMLAQKGKTDVWTPLVEEILRHVPDRGTTLVFVNNRRLCERLAARLNEARGEGFCRSHHGSVSRERRLETEALLREGKLRCLVATSSLELGIDIGAVERVLQIDSPVTAASGIQRFGRSGHAVGGVSRGTIIVRTRGLLPEAAVLAERIGRKETERIKPPPHLAAVLAQQIVAAAAEGERDPDGLYRMICRSDAFHGFPRERFDELVDMLAGDYPFVKPLVRRDPESGRLAALPGAVMAAVTGAGTIPQSTDFPVYHAETGIHLGELDEEFVFESRVGDVFQLGTANWRIRAIRPDRVEVTESPAAYGEIPFWRAEGLGRGFALGLEVGRLNDRLERLLRAGDADGAVKLLTKQYHFTPEAAESLLELIRSQTAASAWPTHRRIVAEWYRDESGLTHLVIHSWFGRRFNRTWLLALRHHLERVYPHEFQSTAKDNGIELIFRVWDPAVLDHLQGVNSETVERLLVEAVPTSPMFAARFRQLAETSLLLSRGFRRVPAWLKRVRSEELLRDALSHGTAFPLVRETLRDCVERILDGRRVRRVLRLVERGAIEWKMVPCSRPSPLAAQFFYDFLNVAVYESDALTRELSERLASVSRELAAKVFGPEALEGPGGREGAAGRDRRAEAERFVRLLQISHHLEPARRLRGPEGVLEALTRLQGLFLPVSWWETFVLPSRVAGYRREDLDLLCASGELFWIGRKEEGATEGKVAFFRPDAAELYAPFVPGDDAVPKHPELYERLRTKGAGFLSTLAAETGEAPLELLGKLLDLVWQGLAANDQFAPLRLHGKRKAAFERGKFRSGLGRWYAVADLAGPRAAEVSAEHAVLGWTKHLLRLGGVLTRALAQAYSPFDWEVHYAALSRLEELGLVTRGLLVRGAQALQFAEKETAARLAEPDFGGDASALPEDAVVVSSADPANPYGLTIDWPAEGGAAAARFARRPDNHLLLGSGRFLLWAAASGRHLAAIDPRIAADADACAECVRQLARCLIRERGQRKVAMESLNGDPVGGTELAERLVRLGAEREGGAFVFWPSAL
ncbi:MAG TPA: DEAD/DEAH box helicase [Paenibacillaceae bacterium]